MARTRRIEIHSRIPGGIVAGIDKYRATHPVIESFNDAICMVLLSGLNAEGIPIDTDDQPEQEIQR